MDVVIARFQRMKPSVFNGDESSEDSDSWLHNVIHLFDRAQYDDELRLRLVTLLLRKVAERWWRGASSTLVKTGVGITWDSFCETFRQEYIPDSYVASREREFEFLEQGSMTVREYARKFSALLAYVPHVAGRERAKSTRFVEGLNEELYQSVLTSKPKTYAKAVDSAINIEEGMRSRHTRRAQVVQGGRPVGQGTQSSQSSQSAHYPQQQVAQQSGRQRFRPHGQQFKKKSGSGSSGSCSSSSSGSRTEFCGFCGGKHPSTQCVGVQGSCNLCGQYGHFARVCPSAGSQQTAAQPQGRGGQSRGRSQQFQQPHFGETPFRPFQQPGPSRFGQSSLLATMADPDPVSRGRSGSLKILPRDTFNTLKSINKPFIGHLSIVTLLASRRLAPTSFTGKPALK
ncbi:hypothetical protein F511_23343 [Dorcoceras hygrometricum]|uniref:CCHC-type domain-containing protein n=1 Tax=Dorcoceras hygrometricum TaxID=472368 RepID=A0A2Z7CTM0_9LAMI|nr:hypothetical protein F511_23343 [Dorcoceras hygrometricum]